MKNDPENYPIPDFAERINAEKNMTPFLTLCVVRSLKMDRTLIVDDSLIQSYPNDSLIM